MNCDFCQAPAIAAKLSLLESAYHEDMAEVFRRLDDIKIAHPFSESCPAHSMLKKREATELPCRTCTQFRETGNWFECRAEKPEFPYLCDEYKTR